MSVLPVDGQVAIGPAAVPAAIRNGSQAATNAYATGLAFEQVLLGELAQELSTTVGGAGAFGSADDGSSSDDASGSSDDSAGLAGSGGADPASTAYADLLPQALSSSVMSAGGSGIAMDIAQSLDPSLLRRR